MNGTAEAHTIDWSVEISNRGRVMIRSRRLREVFPPSEFTSDNGANRWYELGLLQTVAQKSPVVLGLLQETEAAIADLLAYHAAVQRKNAAESSSSASQMMEGDAGSDRDVQ